MAADLKALARRVLQRDPARPQAPQTAPAQSAPLANDTGAAKQKAPLLPEWADGLARLGSMACPRRIAPERWSRAVRDAASFTHHWSDQARGLGWDTTSIFGVHPTHPCER